MKYLLITITIVALYMLSACTMQSYTISFDSQGGSIAEPFSTYFDEDIVLPVVVKDGYEFMGWSLSTSGDIVSNVLELKKSNYTFYAIWKMIDTKFSLTLMSEDTTLDTLFLNAFEPLNLIDAPFKEGFIFIGWFLNQTYQVSLDFINMPNNNLTLYAKYIEAYKNTWVIKYVSQTSDDLTIQIVITGDVDFIGLDANITFDSQSLQVSSTKSDLNVISNVKEDQVLFNYVNALTIIKTETIILTITFKILGENTTISLTINEMISRNDAYDIYSIPYRIVSYEDLQKQEGAS